MLSLALSPEAIGWGVSAVVHAAGVLVAWAAWAVIVPAERPELLGNTTQIELTAVWAEPALSTPQLEILPVDSPVVVMPDRVRVFERTYVPESTDVSQPTPAEVAMVDEMMAVPAATAVRRSAASGADRSARAAAPPEVSRPPRTGTIPTLRASIAASIGGRQSVGTGEATPPRLLENRPPTYPPQAVIDRLEGTVLLRLQITREGRIAKVAILSSSGHPVLDGAAARAVRAWRFVPASRAGRPVAASVRLPVRFALD